jgi:uncharacterized delta-60 repeat protein
MLWVPCGISLGAVTRKALVLLAGIALLLPVATAAPGDFDQGFSGNGRRLEDIPDVSVLKDSFVMRNGRILVAGETANGLLVARYRPNGRPDKSFSGNGRVVTNLVPSPGRIRVVSLPNGTIFVATDDDNDFALIKLTGSGEVDQNYGTNGLFLVDFGSTESLRNLILAHSKLYAVGNSTDMAVARFNSNGLLDTDEDANPGSHWSEDGKLTLEGNIALGLKVLGNGKVLLVGEDFDYNIIMARFKPNGTPDTNYHGDGTTVLPIGNGVDHIENVGLGPGGVVVAADTSSPQDDNFRVLRATLKGTLVNSFGQSGRKNFDLGADENSYVPLLDATGKPIIAGDRYTGEVNRWFFLRLKRNGDRDGSFGNHGLVQIRFRPNSDVEDAQPEGADIQADGRLLGVGYSAKTEDNPDAALARVLTGTCGRLGTDKKNRMEGSPANDFMCGLLGNDKLLGRGGRDRLKGGPGDDVLKGGRGRDFCYGGGGDDTFVSCFNT